MACQGCNFDPLFTKTGSTPEKLLTMSPLSVTPIKFTLKRGRKELLKKYPEIATLCGSFIAQNSYKAHEKRRNNIGNCGVNLHQCRQYIMDNLPILKDKNVTLSLTTIHRLMYPPNKRNKASKLYRSVIKAKIPKKCNNQRLYDPDAHYYHARVKLVRNFAAHFCGNCIEISCDNKNKVNVGTLAVSRQNKINKYFLIEDAPDYVDHDFPMGYKITPMGYMILNMTKEPIITEDKLKRKCYKLSNTGQLNVINRAQQFHSSTVEPHINDLISIMEAQFRNGEKSKKSILVLIVDNGPDWSSSLGNTLFFFRLFKALSLDAMFIVSFCPKYSAYNNIEHAWSYLSNQITGVTLAATLPGEDLPPFKQKLSTVDREIKEAGMLDLAMESLCSYWNGKKFHNFPIVSTFQSCLQRSMPYSDYSNTRDTLRSIKKTKENEDVLRELHQMIQHVDRRIDATVFKKCDSCAHCKAHPIVALEAMKFLNDNPDFPNPQPSRNFKGHFINFFDILHRSKPIIPAVPDFYMKKRFTQLRKKLKTVRCTTCKYTFTSTKDSVVHKSLFGH